MNYPSLEEVSDYLKLLGVDNSINEPANRIHFTKTTLVIQEILGNSLRISLPDKHVYTDRKEFLKDIVFAWDLIKLLENQYLITYPKYDVWEIHYDSRRDSRLS